MRFTPRQVKDYRGANLTEVAYERDVLKPLLMSGAIRGFRFQPITLKFAEKPSALTQACKYTPDWQVTLLGGEWVLVECKRDGKGQQSQKTRARVAIRACAAAFPEFHFTWTEGKLRKGKVSRWTHMSISGAEWWAATARSKYSR